MRRENLFVLILSIVGIGLILTASLAGIITDDGGDPYIFTSLQGEDVEVYGGEGIYKNDSVYKAVMFRGFDWVGLLIVFPLFIFGLFQYIRGRFRGRLLLGGIFTYLAYIYLIGVMGNIFNSMFLVWTSLYSVGIFGVIAILAGIDISAFSQKIKPSFPRKSLSIYAIALGIFLPIMYLIEIITAYAITSPPVKLEIYTTLELAALEIGIMAPLHILGGVLLWKKNVWGYILTIFLAFAASVTFAALSVAQILNFVTYQIGGIAEVIQMVVFAVIASGFSLAAFKHIED